MPKKPSLIETQVVPLPENDRRQRRRWSAAEKKRILDEAEACEARGELGELLRKEGIYSSHLHNWRRELAQHGIVGLEPKVTGRKPLQSKSEREIAHLTRKNKELAAQLSLAQKVIELQKKAHEILGIALPSIEDDSSN
jgi:transposase-like protein